jgi:DNA-directed RNA polymerase subunit RPC12/RpoP
MGMDKPTWGRVFDIIEQDLKLYLDAAEQISKLYKERLELRNQINNIDNYFGKVTLWSRLREIDRLLKSMVLLKIESPLVNLDLECAECHRKHIVNKDKVHHIDGNPANQTDSNTAVICPSCGIHILMSPATPAEIWRLKQKGLNNTEIGDYLGLSRERIRQILEKYKSSQPETTDISKPTDHEIEQKIEYLQGWERNRRPGKRVTDRRTIRKKLESEIQKKGLS